VKRISDPRGRSRHFNTRVGESRSTRRILSPELVTLNGKYQVGYIFSRNDQVGKMALTDTRFDPKRRNVNHKKTQFQTATYKENQYPYRLSIYDEPPTQEISLEEFETWAIDRLRGMFC
jgi:hypothetical protein